MNIKTDKIKEIAILDAMGRVVLTKIFNAINQAKINVSGLPKGLYVARITDADNKILTQKLIIE